MAEVFCRECGHECETNDACNDCGGMKVGDRECPICQRQRTASCADPFGDTRYIKAYATRIESEAFLDGVRACGVTSKFIVERVKDYYSPSGCWFQIMRAPEAEAVS